MVHELHCSGQVPLQVRFWHVWHWLASHAMPQEPQLVLMVLSVQAPPQQTPLLHVVLSALSCVPYVPLLQTAVLHSSVVEHVRQETPNGDRLTPIPVPHR